MGRLREHAIKTLMLAWSEPHALAGHSVHSPGDPYELESLFEAGRCIDAATEWPESQSIPLPGCGDSHFPGAGNRIRLIASTVAEHAVDALLDECGVAEHRIWVSSSSTIEAHGGARVLPHSPGSATTVITAVPRASGAEDVTVAV